MNLLEILKQYEYLNHYTDKNTTHSYIENFYNEEFKKYKDQKINLCEIGIASGGSLGLWNKYFTDCKILGIDNSDVVVEECSSQFTNDVSCIFNNAYDEDFVKNLKKFDIIIDDGPHSLESQKFAVKYYLPKLNDNGIFIIEDVQDYSWFNELIKETPEEYKKNIECLDFRNSKNRYDDMIFVVRK